MMMIRIVLITLVIGLASSTARADLNTEVKCPAGTIFDPVRGCVRRDVPAASTYVVALEVLNADPKKALGLFDTACKAKYPPACTQLGVMYQSGRGRAVVKDETKAQALFERACELGDGPACQKRGNALMSVEPAKARKLLERGCGKNEGVACAQLGYMLEKGMGGAENPAEAKNKYDRAFKLMDKACPKDGLACLARGVMYTKGVGAKADPQKALASYALACEARNSEGCWEIAKQHDEQERKPDALRAYEKACLYDYARACSIAARRGAIADRTAKRPLELATRACDLDTRECEVLALLYDLAYAGLTQDRERATALFKSLCDAGDQSACVTFAKRARAGTGMKANPELADKTLDAACTAEEADACSELAVRYTETKADDARGFAIAKSGCKLGSGHACFVTGWMIHNNRRGAAVAEDVAVKEALPYYDEACEKNSPKGCYEAANLYEAGKGTAKDVALAAKKHRKACEDSERPYASACASLSDLLFAGSGDALKKDVDEAIRLSARACAMDYEGACNWIPRNTKEPQQIKDVTAKLLPACEGGEHDLACYTLGQLLLYRGGNDEKHTGYDVTAKACGRKHWLSCNAQVSALYNGQGVVEDKAKAEQLTKQFCDAGDGKSCTFASFVHRGDKDGERRLRYADQACTLKAADGCNEAGFMYYTSIQGTRWNITQAAEYYVKACELGSALGCSNSGELARYGILGPPDAKKAAELYKKSCELGEWVGCSGWAHYMLRGEGGITKDRKTATEKFRGACTADIDLACVELADVLEADRGGSESEIARLRLKAFELTKKNADTNPGYMYWLGTYYRDGMATMKDPKKALEWFGKSCDGFDPLGCGAAGKQLAASSDAKDREQARVYFQRSCAAGVDESCKELKVATPKVKETLGPSKVQPKGCGCGGEVAPGAEAGLVVVVFAIARRRRRRPS